MGTRVISTVIQYIDKFTKPSQETLKAMRNISVTAKATGKTLQNTGKTISSAGSALTKGITAPVAAIGTAAIKTAADYESAMSNVQAITGATGDDFKTLTKLGKDLGASTAWSAQECAAAMQYTGMAGWTAADNVAGLKGILDLASASGTDLAATSDIMTDAISAFGYSAKDSALFADTMTKACTSANVSVNTLGESYKYCGAICGTMGYSIDEVTTSLAVMGNQGIKGSQAGTTLKNAIANMAAPTSKMKAAMDALGISITNQDGSMKTWGEVIKNLQGSFKGLTEDQQAAYAKQIFGKESMAGMLAIINTSTEDYNALAKSIKNSGGAAESAAQTQLNNLNGQLTLLKSALEGAAITIGDKLLPYIKNAASWVQKATDWFNGLSDAQVSMIMKFAGVAAAIGPTLLIFGKTVSTIGKVTSAFGKVTGAIAKASGIMGIIASPAGAVIAILVALVAAGVLVYKNWDKIKAAATRLKNSIKSAFAASGASGEKFKTKFREIKEQIGPIVTELGIIFKKIVEFLRPIVTFIAKSFVARIKVGFSAIVGLASGLASGLMDYASGIIKMFRGLATFISGVFCGDWKKAFNGLKTFFSGWGTAIVALVKTPINGIIGLVNGAISGINKLGVKIPDWVPGVGGKEFKINVPKIPALARGTQNWLGGLAQINERGGEIVDLPRGTRVYPHDQSVRMAKNISNAKLSMIESRLAKLEGGKSKENGGKEVKISIPKLADQIIVRDQQDIEAIAAALATKLKNTALNMGVC